MKISHLFKNVRFYILVFSVLLSLTIFHLVLNVTPSALQTLRITQAYALSAGVFLYFALLTGPFCYNFKTPFNSLYLKGRRAIGVSAFYFGFLHYVFALFGVIGGIPAIFSLPSKYLIALSFSYPALFILFLMTITSFDFMIKKMTFKKWKILHRFVYISGIFILIHAFLIGEHFQNINPVSIIFSISIIFLIYLEGMRILSNLKPSS